MPDGIVLSMVPVVILDLTMTEEISNLLEAAKKIESALAHLGYAGPSLKRDIQSAREVAGRLIKALDNARMSAQQEAAWGADNGD